MARRATSKINERTSRQKVTAAATDIPADAPRRGRRKLRDAEPAEPLLAGASNPGADEAAPAPPKKPEITATATGDAGTETPAPTRRGRRPKAIPVPDALAEVPPSVSDAEPADAPPGKRRPGRPRKAKAAAPSPQPPADQPGDAIDANAPAAAPSEAAAPAPSAPSAARWDPATGSASFDWPTIEQVAATDGPNQAMARLLLAARAEGANSRWPF